MTIDKNTGLPTIPWEGYFWRTTVSQPMQNKYYYVELRKHTKFLGLFASSKLIKKSIMLELSPKELRKRAQEVLDAIKDDVVSENFEKSLLGDYPPKKLND